jgi:LysM repeat protein
MKSLLPMLAGVGISLMMAFIVFGSFSLSLVENGLQVTATVAYQDTSSSPIRILNLGETATNTLIIPSITPTYPPTPAGCPPPPGWIPRFVQPGESIEVIAQAYLTTIEELMSANCLTTQTISPGKILYVPNIPPTATSSPTPTKVLPTAADSDSDRTCNRPTGWVVYIVHSGDTLYRISVWSGTSVAALQNANCLGTSTVIHPGQQLWVPKLPPTPTPTRYYPLRHTDTPTRIPTSTPVEPSATPVPPTNSPVPPTNTPKPPTPEPPTNTPKPPTDTPELPLTVEPSHIKNNPNP